MSSTKKLKSKLIETFIKYSTSFLFFLEDISYLESLSNEIFYEIFEYFDGCDLIQAFSRLNQRFEDLIQHPSLPLTIQFMNDSHENVEENYRNFILPYKHRIHSLYLDGSDISSKFFRAYTIDGSFTRLESIAISNISYENTVAVVLHLKSLPKLVSLTIDFACDVDKDGSIILQSILQFLTLKYLNITASL